MPGPWILDKILLGKAEIIFLRSSYLKWDFPCGVYNSVLLLKHQAVLFSCGHLRLTTSSAMFDYQSSSWQIDLTSYILQYKYTRHLFSLLWQSYCSQGTVFSRFIIWLHSGLRRRLFLFHSWMLYCSASQSGDISKQLGKSFQNTHIITLLLSIALEWGLAMCALKTFSRWLGYASLFSTNR